MLCGGRSSLTVHCVRAQVARMSGNEVLRSVQTRSFSDKQQQDGSKRFYKNRDGAFKGKKQQQRQNNRTMQSRRNQNAPKGLPYKDPATGIYEGGPLGIIFKPEHQANSNLVPLEMRDEIYELHMNDPTGKGDLNRLANLTGLPVRKIQAIVRIRQVELDYQKNVLNGEPLDRTLDIKFRQYFGTRTDFRDGVEESEIRARLREENRMFQLKHPDLPAYHGDKPQPDSFAGRYDRWKKNPKYNGERVLKKTEKFLFLRAKTKDKFQHIRKDLGLPTYDDGELPETIELTVD